MQRPEPIVSFSAPEGEYRLREELHYDLSPNTFVGTTVSLVTLPGIQSNSNMSGGAVVSAGDGVDTAQFSQLQKFGTSLSGKAANVGPSSSGTATGRFIDVPVQADPGSGDRGYMVFFKDNPPSGAAGLLKRKPMQLSRSSGSGSKSSPGSSSGSTLPNQSVPFNQFLSRVVAHESLPRIILQPNPHPPGTSGPAYMFGNIGKVFLWLEYFAREGQKIGDPLACIYLKEAFPTCHDVNVITRDNLDVCIGFNTGEILCFSPISGRYSRHNRGSILPPGSGVTCIKWMPGSETVFWAGYDDGSVVVWDRERDDPAADFYPKEEISAKFAGLSKEPPPNASLSTGSTGGALAPHQSAHSVFWTFKAGKNGAATFLPPGTLAKPPSGAASNPVALYKVSKKAVSTISFSPDCQHVAIATLDGLLKIVDYLNERLTDTFPSYFGGITTTAWSPDGKFLLTGGQDDLIEVLSLPLRRVLARCQGHNSWVTSVQFDRFRCTERVYRFGSVGEDGRLCLWDFGMHSLHRPRGTVKRMRTADGGTENRLEVVHPVLPRGDVAMIYPVVSKVLHYDPLCSLQFHETGVVTSCRQGIIKIWQRPAEA